MKNILFICSRNQWRSPTAERVWKNCPDINVRSAGTSSSAKRTVSIKDIEWADVILVMEEKHKNRLQTSFRRTLLHKELYILDIPDEYQFMDTELVSILTSEVGAYI